MLNILELWQSAEDSMIQAEYEQAIKILEEIQGFKHLLRAEQLIELKQSFIEAYIKNGQHQKAIQLCQSLINTNKPELKTWAEEKLEIINPRPEGVIDEEPDNLSNGINFKTVQEFKIFAQANLLSILKQFEQKRQWAILSIIVATIFFMVAIYFIVQGSRFLPKIPDCLVNQ
jgi:tetratricopeptide (TPR) repeat protein